MKTILFLLLALRPAGDGFTQAVLTLSGASCVEELDSAEMDRYQELSTNPLDLNRAAGSQLLSSGLFTAWQVKVILRDRSSSGDIMSLTELGLMEGFTPAIAETLGYFVTISPSGRPGQRRYRGIRQSLSLKASVRAKTASSGPASTASGATSIPEPESCGGIKYEAMLGESIQLLWATRTTYSQPRFTPGTISAAYYGKRFPGKVVVGNFAARFGQGLAIWSGFRLSGYPSVSSFRRNGSGLSATSSVSSELCGIAADYSFGDWTASAAYSFKGGLPLVNLCRTARTSTLAMTATSAAASADWHFSLPDISFFGEMAVDYEKGPQTVCGAIWTPVYGTGVSILARWFSPALNEYSGAAAGFENKFLCATFDASRRSGDAQQQYKTLLQIKPEVRCASVTLRPSLRLNWRLRPGERCSSRLDLRAETSATIGRLTLGGRYNALWCKEFAWLWYLEAGWNSGTLSAWLRGGLFKVDNWDDRIYVYERDAPGSFSVPAYYGRGWNASAYAAWHISRHHSLFLRCETVQYPWNLTSKDGKLEVRLQYRLRLG